MSLLTSGLQNTGEYGSTPSIRIHEMDHRTNYGLRTFSTAVRPVPARAAVMVTKFWPRPNCPVRVVAVKVRVLCPPATVTVAGPLSFRVSRLANGSVSPPAGAGPLTVTVP